MEWEQIGAAVGALIIGAGAVVARWYRTRSHDNLDKAKAQAETRIISRLEEERNLAQAEARREHEERVANTKRIARLEAENAYLKSYAKRLLRVLSPEERAIFETDFSALDDDPPPPAPR